MAEKGIRGGICHPIYQFAKKLSTTKVSKYIPLSFSVATISLVKNIENRRDSNRHIFVDSPSKFHLESSLRFYRF